MSYCGTLPTLISLFVHVKLVAMIIQIYTSNLKSCVPCWNKTEETEYNIPNQTLAWGLSE